MDDRTLTALKGSIAKWEGIVAGAVKDEGVNNCPLCQLFHFDRGGADNPVKCGDCPVRKETGNYGCGGTPYDDYEYMKNGGSCDNYDNLESAAQAELDFLRSLLPDDAA